MIYLTPGYFDEIGNLGGPYYSFLESSDFMD